MLEILKQFVHEREINQDDKYFLVTVYKSKKAVLEIGWIEKEFNQDEFKKKTGCEVLSYKEFKNKTEYENEKYKNQERSSKNKRTFEL